MAAVILWFRRDLRLADHPALSAALTHVQATGGEVVPLFVLDEALLGPSGANRRSFLAANLGSLDAALGGTLTLRRGRPADVVAAVAAEVGAEAVFATGDCAPYGRRRDDEVAATLAAAGRRFERIGSPYAVSPGRVRNGTGQPYRVFTPFSKAWQAHGWPDPIAAPKGGPWRAALSDANLGDVGPLRTTTALLPEPGEAAAWAQTEHFLADQVARYADERNRPDLPGTSRLSPYLRFGVLHPRQLLARLGDDKGSNVFRSELAWREFYADVLWHHPDSARASLQPVGARLRWDEGPEAEARFAAWCEGRTGVPLVDAGMRQLVTEGWMHNRVRMLTASCLV